ncbi:HAAS signaling domain-containing protein [Paenibacillus macerans]|uniref:HAAS signaling domain-containing protein n=1 Tax=Paenibacillus macerans TaxID=44252 RepID=UPI003D30F558
MNKSEFLALLRAHLSALPPEEQNELLEDYEAHFAFGQQSGRSEEEIVMELGDPAELAKEALGNRYVPQDHVYWFGGGEPVDSPAPEPDRQGGRPIGDARVYTGGASGIQGVRRRGAVASIMAYIGLFFANIIAGPLLIAFWAVAVSLATAALAGILSPLLLGLEYVMHGNLSLAKLFAALATVGLGILLAVASRYLFKGMIRLSAAYLHWNARIAKGVN